MGRPSNAAFYEGGFLLLNVNRRGEWNNNGQKKNKKKPIIEDGQRLHTAIHMYGITLFGNLALNQLFEAIDVINTRYLSAISH